MEVYYRNTLPKPNSSQVFPQGISSPFKLYPSTCSPRPFPDKTCCLGTTTCPVSPPSSGSPSSCRNTAGRGHPGQRPGTAWDPSPAPSPGPRRTEGGRAQPRRSRGSARPEHSTACPRPGTAHTPRNTRARHALHLAPVTCHLSATAGGERTPTPGPAPGFSRVTTAGRTDTDKQEKAGEKSSPLPLPWQSRRRRPPPPLRLSSETGKRPQHGVSLRAGPPVSPGLLGAPLPKTSRSPQRPSGCGGDGGRGE